MNRREFIKGAAGLALAPGVLAACGERRPTNLVLITVDDMNWNTPGCNGGAVPDATPHIDRLASEGMRFVRGHVNISVCRPSRAVFMTGRYPHRNGTLVAEPIRDEVPVLTDALREAGYHVGIIGKVNHLRPVERFAWEIRPDLRALGLGRDPSRYGRHAADFMNAASKDGRPFFLMVNTHDPHRPFAQSADESKAYADRIDEIRPPSRTYRPDEVPVPGFLPDLPAVRREVAQYYGSVRRADDAVGAVLDEIAEAGREQDTLVLLVSDNGMAFPFAKTNCYLNSTRVPWIVRWPGRVEPGCVDTDHFVSAIDVMPTLLDAAGLDAPQGIDGRSFRRVLEGGGDSDRDRVLTLLYRDFGGRPRPIRCIRLGDLGYIFNAWSNGRDRFANESLTGLSWAAMVRAGRSDPAIQQRVNFYSLRQPEELYDFGRDPDALHDLSRSPTSKDRLATARRELLDWMRRIEDPLHPTFERYLKRLGAYSA